MYNIYEYIKLSREERRKHLKLEELCIERGGYSRIFRGLLAHILDTTIPEGSKIYLCHACHNGKCSNPNHLYWGTPKDNHKDQVDNGTYQSLYVRTKNKHGENGMKDIARKAGLSNKNSISWNNLSEEEIKRRVNIVKKHSPFVRGSLGQCAKEIGISHTSLRRFIEKFKDRIDV